MTSVEVYRRVAAGELTPNEGAMLLTMDEAQESARIDRFWTIAFLALHSVAISLLWWFR